MNDYRDQIKNLAFTVNEGLTVYITIHDRIFKEAATFKSFLNLTQKYNITSGNRFIRQVLE